MNHGASFSSLLAERTSQGFNPQKKGFISFKDARKERQEEVERDKKYIQKKKKKRVSIGSLRKAGREGWETGEKKEGPGRLSEDTGHMEMAWGRGNAWRNNSESHTASNREAVQGSIKHQVQGTTVTSIQSGTEQQCVMPVISTSFSFCEKDAILSGERIDPNSE